MNQWRTIKATDITEATELAWELATTNLLLTKQQDDDDDDGNENYRKDDVEAMASGVHDAKKKDPSFSY